MGIESSRWLSHRVITPVVVLAAMLLAGISFAFATPREEIAYEFQRFHDEAGGVSVFGHAISPRVTEHGRVTQYFERQRFEHHPENKAPYNVLLGRLGVEDAERRGLKGTEAFEPLETDEDADSECRYFDETGHQICSGFKEYWESNGLPTSDAGDSKRESLLLFGYPISDEFTDPDTGLTVQYFERARFEYHPENVDTEYEVLLGHVGTPQWEEREQFAELASEPEVGVANGDFIWPAEGEISQHFGHTAHSSAGGYGGGGHTGLDIADDVNTPIHAADGGTVVESGWMGGYGYTVMIDHGNGYETLYAHMAEEPPVSVGQEVSQGEFIGPMGSTGYSSGPHLHFEILKDGHPMDPLQYLE